MGQFLYPLVLLLCLIPESLKATDYTVHAHIPVADLIGAADYSDDPTGEKTLQDMLAAPDSAWQPGADNKLTFGWSTHAYWVRLSLKNPENRPQHVVLEIDWPLLDDIQLHVLNPDGQLVETMIAGDMRPFKERPIAHTSFAFPLQLPAAGQHLLYIRVASTSSVQIPLKLWQQKMFYEERQYTEGAQILYYGAMLIMVFYNFFIFLSVRQATYLYYSFFVIGYIVLQASLKGIAFHYIWPDLPGFIDRSISMGGALTLVFMMLFARSFLHIGTTHPWMSRTLLVLIGLTSLSFIAAGFVPYRVIIKVVAGLSIVCSTTALASGIYALAKGQKEARYYVSAWAALVLGCVLYMLKQFGIVPRNPFTENAMQVGSVLEAVLLSFSLADRLNTLKSSLQKANAALSDHVRNVEALVDQKTRSIRSILDTLHQGIVTFAGNELRVQHEYAKYTESLLGTQQIAQKDLMDLIFVYSDLSVDDKARMVEALRSCLGEPLLGFELNAGNLPTRCELQLPGRERISLELDWTPIVDSDQITSRMMLSFRDVTEIRKLRAAADNQQHEMRVISELVQADPRKLKRFFAGARAALEEDQRLCGPEAPYDPELIKILFIDMHTIKGESRGLGLSRLSDAAHLLEEEYARLRQNKSGWSPLSLRESLAHIEGLLDSYQHTFEVKLQGLSDADKVAISYDDLGRWHSLISGWSLNPMDQKNRQVLLENWARQLYIDFAPYLQSYRTLCSRVARDLNKPEPDMVTRGDQLYLDKSAVPLLDKILMHLLRNALDHGLESPEERISKGKAPRGRIEFSWSLSGPNIRVRMQDDGRGLQLNRIRMKAQKLGMPVEGKSNLELAQFIFETGLTTTDTVTSISGRGVGLAAVRQYLKEAGGDVQIEWSGVEGNNFAFIILLPRTLLRGVSAAEPLSQTA